MPRPFLPQQQRFRCRMLLRQWFFGNGQRSALFLRVSCRWSNIGNRTQSFSSWWWPPSRNTWGPTRRASKACRRRTAFARSTATHRPHIAWVRSIVAVMLFVGGAAILLAVSLLPLGGSDDRAAGALCRLFLLLIVATLLVPLWTIRPPALGMDGSRVLVQSAPWYLAREACRFAASRTLATVVPFAIASSLLAVLYGGGAISGGGTSLTEIGVLLGPTVVVAWWAESVSSR